MSSKNVIFKSAYSTKESMPTEPGSIWQATYTYEINGKGQKELKKTGEENIYEKIQAELEETKIENVLKRVAVGDMSDFRPQGIYQDISDVPNNLIAAKKEMQKLENMWNKLPGETKAKYDWSVETFIAEAGKESWLVDTGLIQPTTPEPVPNLKEETTVEVPKETKE